MWLEIQEQIMVESAQIDQLLQLYRSVVAESVQSPPDFVKTAALATMLHSFYTGVENIFKRIAIGIDGGLPTGSASHSALLNVMVFSNEHRSAVISETSRIQLKMYMNFRHVFRHAYSFELDWDKMAQLVWDCEHVWHKLQAELTLFFKQM